MRLTVHDKLRTLIAASIGGEHVYTQKELAEQLGVSTRTLRRFKNIPGYRLASRTQAKIKTEVTAENRRFRSQMRDKAYDPKTQTLVKSPRLRLPTLPVQPVPTLYTAKSGLSQTLKIDSKLWSTQDKIKYAISAANSGRFYSWTARIKVPVGVATSGDVESTEVNEGERPVYYMIGPFTLQADTERGAHGVRKKIERELSYHEDAGRIVMSISIVENLPGKNSEQYHSPH